MTIIKTCTIEGCEKRLRSRGWCAMHLWRSNHHGDPLASVERRASGSAEDRLRFYGWKVTPSGCWEFAGGRNRDGYGWVRDPDMGRQTAAHRVAYRVWVGPIASDLEVRHACDNPPCINPDHLSLGTHAENLRDALERNRVSWGEARPGAKLTERDVQTIRELLQHGHTQSSIGSRFGVSQSVISRIKSGHDWRRTSNKEVAA